MKFKRIYIEITNYCNLTCDFCAKNNRPKRFMSLTQFQMISEQIRFYTDFIYLHVQGEPLLHPQIREILEIAHSNRLKVQLVTNGTLISQHMDVLKDARSIRQISVSLQSLLTIEYLNDPVKAIQLYEDIIQLSKHGIIIQLRYWIYNKQVFTKIMNDCLSYFGIDTDKLNSEKKRYSTQFPQIFFSLDEPFEWPSNPQIRSALGTCYGTRDMLGILSDGTLVPCCLDHQGVINLGNVFDTSFSVLLDNPLLNDIRSGFRDHRLIEPFCQSCGYRHRFDKKTVPLD